MKLSKIPVAFFLAVVLPVSCACAEQIPAHIFVDHFKAAYEQHDNYNKPPLKNANAEILKAAKTQLTREIEYDPDYYSIDYPGGDVPPDKGVCTDVVIRALRGIGVDLQQLVHQDMKKNYPALYPNIWGLNKPDSNIDHRRVPNLMAFLHRHATPLPLGITGEDLKTWQPGDIVVFRLSLNRQHVGIVSDRKNGSGQLYVIHHWPGQSVAEEDVIDTWSRLGHYRWPIIEKSSPASPTNMAKPVAQ
jgi:uncharacterized protein YijF (DUF1287 family)